MLGSVVITSISEEGLEEAEQEFARQISKLQMMLLIQVGQGPIATAVRDELGIEPPTSGDLTIVRPPHGAIVWDSGEQFASKIERSKEAQRRKARLENMVRSALSRLGPFREIVSSSDFSWLALEHPEFRATVWLITEKTREGYTVFVGPNLQARCFKGGAVPWIP